MTTAYSVLVVEDNQSVGGLLQELLEDEGYKVERASDGQHALGCINGNDPDAVLLDVRLPAMDGLQVLKVVRAAEHDTSRRLPIMLLSGTASDIERRAGLAAGADDYLAKPFELDDLLERVKSLLTQRHVTTEIPIPADPHSSAV